MISKKDISELSALARIEIPEEEANTLVKDLEQILSHFDELKNVNTDSIPQFADATHERNITRDDTSDETRLDGDRSVDTFPEQKGRYLKIPPVFE